MSTVLAGGVETTTSAIGSGLVHLGRNPDVRHCLVEDPSLIPGACEEILRMWPPLPMFSRTAKRSCAIDGHEVQAGDSVALSLAGANRDPEHFADPDEFVVDRQPNPHMTFTVGIHRCIGSHLARMEMRVAFEEILRRIPDYELVDDGVELAPTGGIYGYDSIRATFTPGPRETT